MKIRLMSNPRLLPVLSGALAMAALTFVSAPAAFAANTLTVWGNTGNTTWATGTYDWNTAGNWGAGAGPVPIGAGNIAQLRGNTSQTITLNLTSSITIGAISRAGSQTNFIINGSAITMDGTGMTTVAGTNTAGAFVAGEAALMSNQNNSTFVNLTINAGIIMLNTNLGIGGRSGTNSGNSMTIGGNITNGDSVTRQLNFRGGLNNAGTNTTVNGSIGATAGGGGGIAINNLITGNAGVTVNGAIGGATGTGAAITLENAATGTGTLSLTGVLGQTITSITQNSSTSRLSITSNAGNTNYAEGFVVKSGTLALVGPGGNSTTNFGSGNVTLGDTSGSANVTLSMGNTNNYVTNVNVLSTGGTKTFSAISSSTSSGPVISGNLLLQDNLTVGGATSTSFTFAGANNSIASGKTLILVQNATVNAYSYTLNGTFTGAGAISASGTTNQTTSIKFASTTSDYGGGTSLGAMGAGLVEVAADTVAGVGSFGSGAITLNGATLRADATADRSLSNAITIAADTTFATQASEKSLTFAGNATLTGNRTLTVNTGTTVAGKAVTFSAPVGEDAAGRSLTKAGTGTLVFEASNTYTGSTLVTAGTLVVGAAGSLNNSSSVVVSTGSTLTNNGTALTPALGLGEGATLAGSAGFTPTSLTISADLGGGFSTIVLSSSLAKSGALDFSLTNPTDGSYALFSGTAPTGLFSSVSVGGNALAPLGGNVFSAEVGGFAYTYDDNLNTLGIAAIPEPATLILASLGLAAIFIRRRTAGRTA